MGAERKQGRVGISKACKLAERGPQVLFCDAVYVMVINIINCFLLTVNLMKNIVMDPILR